MTKPGGEGERALGRTSANHSQQQKERRTMKRVIAIAVVFACGQVMSPLADDAKEIWGKQCAKCHGADGKGQTKMGQKLGVKDLTDAKVQADLKDDAAFKATKEGVKDKNGKTLMKAAEGVADEDIKALVVYVRSFKK
jgi:mono/diheme cytochrome c family protein